MKSRFQDRAVYAILHGSLTNSKRPQCFVRGVFPTHIQKTSGVYAWDFEHNRYIDFICGLGSNLLGAQNPKIKAAVIDQLDRGTVFSLGSGIEVQAAEKLREIFYQMGKVRFLKTGTEACMASLRIARSHTGRSVVFSEGYHGWSNEFISLTSPGVGCVRDESIQKFSSLDQINESVAAVIVEPVITDHSPARIQFLKDLRDKCTKTGTMLIFDEIITGFRFQDMSVTHFSGVKPDILLLGKAMGGGFPLSAVMTAPGIGEDQEWFVSSTFAGDTIALVAFMALAEQLNSTHRISRIWGEGARFCQEFNAISPLVQIQGYPTRGVLAGNDLHKALFMQEACKAGMLFGASWFFAFPHIELRDVVINSCKDILFRIEKNMVSLEGEMPQKPFAQKQRE